MIETITLLVICHLILMLIIMMKVKIIYFLSSYLWMILLVMVSMLRTIVESMLIGVCLLRIENKAGVMVGE